MSDPKAALRAEDVLRDVGYPAFVASLFNRSGHQAQDFTHAVLGVATETHELLVATDAVNGLEEQGDLRFYGQAVINLVEEFTGLDFDYDLADSVYKRLIAHGEVIGSEAVINEARTDILDVAKRWIGYGKEPENLQLAGAQVIALVQFVSEHARFSEEDACKVELVNVDKLLLRYKGLKFNANHAVNRDVQAERSRLEASAS